MHFGAYYNTWNMHWNVPFWGIVLLPLVGFFILALLAWTLYWKGRALWLAAKRGEMWWFIALLLINTAGILEILYIYRFSRKNKK